MNRARLIPIWLAMMAAFLGLSTRLVFLQVVHTDSYSAKAEKRRRRLEFLVPRRGRIVDRKKRVLAVDQPRFQVAVKLTALDPSLDLAHKLARKMGLEPLEVVRRFQLARLAGSSCGRYALIGRPRTERHGEYLAKFLSKQHRYFRRWLGDDALDLKDEPVLKWLPGRGVAVKLEFIQVRDRVLARLAALLKHSQVDLGLRVDRRVHEIMTMEGVYERLEAWSRPHVMLPDISFSDSITIEECLFELPGVHVRKVFKRHYPFRGMASHVLGYMSRMSAKEYKKQAVAGRILDIPRWYHKNLVESLQQPDLIYPPDALLMGAQGLLSEGAHLHSEMVGRTGLERRLDSVLSGVPGAQVIERDYKNHRLGILAQQSERHGRDLQISLDVDLQKTAEEALEQAVKAHGEPDAGGAAVVMSVRTGDVLTLASYPRYDLNTVKKNYRELLADPRKVLFHRASAAMPPGSTFKVVTSLAMFDSSQAKYLKSQHSFHCSGQLFRNYSRSFKCDGVHGHTGLERALERSCNVFFWRGVDALGYDSTYAWAQKLGFASRVSDGIPGESAGQIPNQLLKEQRYLKAKASHEAWQQRLEGLKAELKQRPGDDDLKARIDKTKRYLIRAQDWHERCSKDRVFSKGNARNAVIGQGDVLASPIQIASLAAFIANDGEWVKPRLLMDTPVQRRRVEVPVWLMRAIQSGLRRVVRYGTASKPSIGLRALDVAGKTGTAERRRNEPMYAWFMGYYPASNPEIAFAVVVDKTHGHGGSVAGPVAAKLVRHYQQLSTPASAGKKTPQ